MRTISLIAAVGALVAVGIGYFALSLPPVVIPPHVPEGSPTLRIPPWYVYRPAAAIINFFASLVQTAMPPNLQVIEMSVAYWKSEILYALTKNNIIDKIGEGPKTCSEIAEELDLIEHAVCQYTKAGASLGLLKLSRDGTYTLSPAGELVQTNAPNSFRDFVVVMNELTYRAWRGAATQSIKTGESGVKAALGRELWEHFDTYPEEGAQFDRALAKVSSDQLGTLLSSWRPPTHDLVFCDIGGGVGATLATFLEHYPNATGIVFDQPTTSNRAEGLLAQRGLSRRARAVGGDFFQPLPAELFSCDVFLLKFVLHDWPDKEDIAILKNIKAIAKAGAKVLFAEQVMDIGNGLAFDIAASLMSVNMLASCPRGARERTLEEFEDLFAAAGYGGKLRLIRTRDVMSLVEVDT